MLNVHMKNTKFLHQIESNVLERSFCPSQYGAQEKELSAHFSYS